MFGIVFREIRLKIYFIKYYLYPKFLIKPALTSRMYINKLKFDLEQKGVNISHLVYNMIYIAILLQLIIR